MAREYGRAMDPHPLLTVFLRASRGDFPAPDGHVTFLDVHRVGVEAIVAFTGHAFFMTVLSRNDFAGLPIDGFGGAHHPHSQLRVARSGRVGVIDATLVSRPQRQSHAEDVAEVVLTNDYDQHARVTHAREIRGDVKVYANPDGLITISAGLAGRQEMSVEVFDPGHGRGRSLIRAAQRLADPAQPLFAAVSPGNARSFRAFQSEGFSIIASEVVIKTRGTGSLS